MRTTVLTAVCLLIVSLAQAGGKQVLVAIGRQGAVKGELVEVGDTTLVLAVEKDGEELKTVSIRDVWWVTIKARNYVAISAMIGVVGGGIIGGIIGRSTEPPDAFLRFGALKGAGIGAVVGLAIGYGIGSAASSDEIRVTPDDRTFRQVLRAVARDSR